jgi:hypothetical protein
MPEDHSEISPFVGQQDSMLLDLNLFPLSRSNAQEQPGFPGVYMVTPPRKTARGRERDRLILFFVLSGNAPLTNQQQDLLLARLAQTYYKTPGSITAAQRVVADKLNQYLLDRNLRSSSSGRQGIGWLEVAVLREDLLTLGQCGPTHAILVSSQDTQHLHDPQTSGRGLGLTRSVSMRFFQARLQNNDLIILSQQPPTAWTSGALQNAHKQGIESLRRRLISQAGDDLNAVLIQVLRGTGKLRMMRHKPPSPMVQPISEGGLPTVPPEHPTSVTAEVTETAAAEIPADPLEAVIPTGPEGIEDEARTGIQPEAADHEPVSAGDLFPLHFQMPDAPPSNSESATVGDVTVFQAPIETTPREKTPTFSPPAEDIPSRQGKAAGLKPRWLGKAKRKSGSDPANLTTSPVPKARTSLFLQALARVAAFILHAWQRVSDGLGRLMRRILPDESIFTIPASTMIFVAVAVAVVVATTGGMMYFQRGRSIQYQVFYDQALEAAQEAAAKTDPIETRTDWEITLHFLSQAEAFLVTTETETLRAQARQSLDQLDSIERLDFQPAIVGGLAASTRITRMFTTDSDLYLLDATNGTVTRAILTGHGYERDPNFLCSGNPTIGPIIDISPLPKGNNLKATVLAMDANANLLYCIPGSLPVANSPAPPQTNWGGPMGFTYDAGDLYVLDPPANAVWIYRNINLSQEPRLFFGSQVPFMPDVIDLAVNRNDLYLLHSDGHITTCTYSGLQESPTRCQDPTTYYDSRIGRQNGPIIHDAPFSQILYTQPPDPSIYMLDPVNQAIYHFSLRLTFQRQFRPLTDLGDGEATAFTISPNRIVFIAVGNRVYYTDLP